MGGEIIIVVGAEVVQLSRVRVSVASGIRALYWHSRHLGIYDFGDVCTLNISKRFYFVVIDGFGFGWNCVYLSNI